MSDIFNELKGYIPKSIKSKGTFQVDFMGIIPATAPKHLTSETTFYYYYLIVDAYSKIPKLYAMEIIINEEVMDKFDMFHLDLEKWTNLSGGVWK